MSALTPCPRCRRHVRSGPAGCPFCGQQDLAPSARPLPPPHLSRAQLLAWSAALGLGCASAPPGPGQASPPPPPSASAQVSAPTSPATSAPAPSPPPPTSPPAQPGGPGFSVPASAYGGPPMTMLPGGGVDTSQGRTRVAVSVQLPSQFRPAAERALRASIQKCVASLLDTEPTAHTGSLSLRITTDGADRVTGTRLMSQSGGLPPGLAQCIERAAQQTSLPTGGSTAPVLVEVQFSPR